MLSVSITRLKDEVDTVKRLIATNEKIRLAAANDSLGNAELLAEIRSLSDLALRQFGYNNKQYDYLTLEMGTQIAIKFNANVKLDAELIQFDGQSTANAGSIMLLAAPSQLK